GSRNEELGGDRDEEGREEERELAPPEARLEPRASHRADRRGQADERGRAGMDTSVVGVEERPGERRHSDRRERGRHRVTLLEARGENEQRHDDDPASDPEERAEEARREADDDELHRRIVGRWPPTSWRSSQRRRS